MQQTIQIEGVPLHVIDTAGLRDSDDEVERIGIARAWTEIEGADAVLFLHDLSRMHQPGTVPQMLRWQRFHAAENPGHSAGDRCVEQNELRRPRHRGCRCPCKPTLGKDFCAYGRWLEALRRILLEVAGWQSAPEGIYIARARHVQALAQVGEHLEQASGPTAHRLARAGFAG